MTKVCILSPNPISSEQLARQLMALGYEAQAYLNLESFNARSQGKMPDIFVVDKLQGNSSAIEQVKALRGLSLDRPIILFLHKSEESQLESMHKAGISDFLLKPFHKDALKIRMKFHRISSNRKNLARSNVLKLSFDKSENETDASSLKTA